MADTKIEWAERVWNPITGCTKISPGCNNCYAERMSKRLAGRCGYPADDPFKVTLHPERLHQPLRWRKPSKIFVCSMADLFHDDVPFEFMQRVLWVIWHSHIHNFGHTFMILTKRPERMQQFFSSKIYADSANSYHLPQNLWLGVTAENQEQADKRIPILLQIPAAVRFVSVEPMLSAIKMDFGWLGRGPGVWLHRDQRGWLGGIDWVIAGCESGPRRRPADIQWFRSLRDQCIRENTPFFLKQMDNRYGSLDKMPILDGQSWNQFPEVSQ